MMTYRIVFLITSRDEYDLLTKEEFNSKDEDYWSDWNWLEGEINVESLLDACQRRHISTSGKISTTDDKYQEFANYLYTV